MQKSIIALCAMFIFLSGCMGVRGRAHNLSNDAVTKAMFVIDYREHGHITMEGKNGEHFKGDFDTINKDGDVGGYHLGLNKGTGATTLVGDRGTTIDFKFVVDRVTMHGHGEGIDDKGNTYRIKF